MKVYVGGEPETLERMGRVGSFGASEEEEEEKEGVPRQTLQTGKHH